MTAGAPKGDELPPLGPKSKAALAAYKAGLRCGRRGIASSVYGLGLHPPAIEQAYKCGYKAGAAQRKADAARIEAMPLPGE